MIRRATLLILLILALSCIPATAQDNAVPRFEPTDCPIISEFPRTECGYLIVPEDRAQADSPTIKVMVLRYLTANENPAPDPLVMLAGGPGGSGLLGADNIVRNGMGQVWAGRDLVFLDQRGTGYSEPSLDCPEMDAAFYVDLELPLTTEANSAHFIEVANACGDRLEAEGINLAAYNSAASAADLNDLRQVLGYEQFILFGVSYGTRLGLATMRDYPDMVRSAILDSVYPPQIDAMADLPRVMERSVDALFAACAAQERCNTNYPELETTFYDLVARLNEQPITLSLVMDRPYEAYLNGDMLIKLVFTSMYNADHIRRLPAALAQLAEGRDAAFRQLATDDLYPFLFSDGMHYAVQCREEVVFSDPANLEAASADIRPEIRRVMTFYSMEYFAICGEWGAGTGDEIESEAVVSDVPTLLLAGEFDPITPPDYAIGAAETLSQHFYYEFPSVGHGVVRSNGACALGILYAFLDNPTAEPDSSCIAQISPPRFS